MDIKQILSEQNIVPNKALGQNFLCDDAAVHKIVEVSDTEGKNVLEIGPGLGSLTKELTRFANKVLSVEIDKTMVAALGNMKASFPGSDRLTVMQADFLKVDNAEIQKHLGGSFCVVANLPYYITTPICMKLLQSGLDITGMTLMMQKEASAHFSSKTCTKLYSPLSVLSNYLYDIKKVIELYPSSYYPEPDVDSVVLDMKTKHSDLSIIPTLSKVLKASFSLRRKTILNNLSTMGYSKDKIRELLDCADIDPQMRAEQLDTDTFVRLSYIIRDN